MLYLLFCVCVFRPSVKKKKKKKKAKYDLVNKVESLLTHFLMNGLSTVQGQEKCGKVTTF